MTGRRFELGERGRVPFALVGVLLLVTSAAFAGAVAPAKPTPEPAVDVVVERTTADARAALRSAVSEAAVAAASSPVLAAAPTEWGHVLNQSESFRDALRVRIYLAARERFRAIGHERNGVQGSASLAETPTPAELRAAKRRVSVERAGPDGSELRATVSNITVTATEGERVVGRSEQTLTVTVPSPVLAAHDRVETFESRLNAGLLKPGLAQQLTVRLWALAWARGYAQYSGAPVSNVVANRHVELMTNSAVLEVQEGTLGASDRAARDALETALLSTGARDVTSAVGSLPSSTSDFLDEQLRLASRPSESDDVPRITTAGSDAGEHDVSGPNESVDVSVGMTADRAFLALGGRADVWDQEPRDVTDVPKLPLGPPKGIVNDTIGDVHSARVGLLGASQNLSHEPVQPDVPEGTQVLDREKVDENVVDVSPAGDGPSIAVPEGLHRLRTYNRTVRVRHVWELRVETANGTAVVRRNATQRRSVRVGLVGRHADTSFAPDHPIRHVHERGGRFDWWNLANLTDRAEREVVRGRGGVGELAGQVALGSPLDAVELGEVDTSDRFSRDPDEYTAFGPVGVGDTESNGTLVSVSWSDGLWRWIYRDLGRFRDQIRNESVSVPRGELSTYEVNPVRELKRRLIENRSRLVEVPETYDSVAKKARVAVRALYLDTVIAALERRAQARSDRRAGVEDRFEQDGSPASLSLVRDARATRNRNASFAVPDEPRLRVDGAPPYLTTMALESQHLPSIQGNETTYPLVARNVNLASIPYASVVDSFLSTVLGGPSEPKAKLETAGQALRAANESADTGDGTFSRNRTALREAVQTQLWGDPGSANLGEYGGIAGGLALVLDDYGVEDPGQRVSEVLHRWETVHARALAVANGSVVDPLVAAATEHADGALETQTARDELRSTLRAHLSERLESRTSKVKAATVEAVSSELQSVAGDRINRTVTEATTRTFNRSISAVPAGIPILPFPGAWVATANLWTVTVRGEYHRFAVEAPRRTPGAGDPSLTYVRDGSNVTLDVNGDGERELLGRSTRVNFEAQTAVVVVVPPGKSGVGDVNGEMFERSEGWPHAGLESERPAPCLARVNRAVENGTVSVRERQRMYLSKPEDVPLEYHCRNQFTNGSATGGPDDRSALDNSFDGPGARPSPDREVPEAVGEFPTSNSAPASVRRAATPP